MQSTIDAYHSALNSLDAKKVEALWAHVPYAMLINPGNKAVSVGWENVKKNWEDTFNAFSQLKVTQSDGPHIHIKGHTAWADGIASASVTPKSGQSTNIQVFELDVFERHGGHWLLVSHSALGIPK